MKDTRPFSIEHAKAGAPYECRDGQPATVLKWDCKSQRFPLLGVYGKDDSAVTWTAEGIYTYDGVESIRDLVMTPLGEIDGKPVFTGDLLEMKGASGYTFAATSSSRDFSDCRWPAPAKQYPQTQMDFHALVGAAMKTNSSPMTFTASQVITIANTALRHAIDAGQVVTKEDYKADLVRLGDSLRPVSDEIRSARDMAIAEAVRDACHDALGQNPGQHFGAQQIIRGVHLTSIIEKVGK